MKKIKVSAVSYLNTKPFLHGIFQKGLDKLMDLSLDIPSVCADKLIQGKVQLGLVPVAIIPTLKTPFIISDFCIGAVGAVRTVCIYAERPIEEIEVLHLDYQSRTSVELAQVLLREHWGLTPECRPAEPGYESKIGGVEAGLVIGDRAIALEERYPYVYDLAEIWQQHTGLPFVFACWVSNETLPLNFIRQFNEALEFGITSLDYISQQLSSPHPSFSLKDYFREYISYDLDESKKRALALFLKKVSNGNQLPVGELKYL